MPDPGVLAVVYGGPSAEHEVSCISARRIAKTALETGFVVKAIGLTHDKQWVDADRVLAEIDDVDALPSPTAGSDRSTRVSRRVRWCSPFSTDPSARMA